MHFSGFQPNESGRQVFMFDKVPARPSFGGQKLVLGIVWLSIYMIVTLLSAAAQSAGTAAGIKDTDSVVHGLCDKSVALLGESPVHGFGKTLEFKAELVRRLVDECHYNALFVESGTYDYIAIQRNLESGRDVTDSMISAAIGGLWANKEVQSLIPFLRERVKSGRLTLGGLDDQIGVGTYASHEMGPNLVQYLQGDNKSRCRGVLQRHLLWQYTGDDPYNPADKAKILGCLDQVEEGISQPGQSEALRAEQDRMMIDSLRRNLARNFTEDDLTQTNQKVKWGNDRDKSMYLNFQWLLSHLPSRSKVIVWAATVHVVKDLSSVSGWDGTVPLGSYIRRDFGERAFSLGFSAYSGTYAMVRSPVRALAAAPETSLEGQSFVNRNADTMYYSLEQLRNFGPVAARLLGTNFKTARWDALLDGLVIFREERAPEYLPH